MGVFGERGRRRGGQVYGNHGVLKISFICHNHIIRIPKNTCKVLKSAIRYEFVQFFGLFCWSVAIFVRILEI